MVKSIDKIAKELLNIISGEKGAKRDGELLLFANDAKGFFENNSGTMKVTIERVD